MKNIKIIFIILLLLNGCTSLKEAGKVLRNEKTNSTDEFLVKKRNPLVLPPNFEDVPKPGSINKKSQNEKEKIKKILNAPKTEEPSTGKSSSIEESILKRIRK
tara:strand:+ start:65 stop:373 length:309 start_codon:yes stop_codon:yes gene_type:complete